jgi:hypothetical protein
MSSSRNADMEPPRSLRSLPPEGAAGGFGRPGAAGLDSSAVEHLLGYLLAVAEVPTRRTFQHHIGGPFDLRPVEFTLLVLLHANGRASASRSAALCACRRRMSRRWSIALRPGAWSIAGPIRTMAARCASC